jgi:hypothetical protein
MVMSAGGSRLVQLGSKTTPQNKKMLQVKKRKRAREKIRRARLKMIIVLISIVAARQACSLAHLSVTSTAPPANHLLALQQVLMQPAVG